METPNPARKRIHFRCTRIRVSGFLLEGVRRHILPGTRSVYQNSASDVTLNFPQFYTALFYPLCLFYQNKSCCFLSIQNKSSSPPKTVSNRIHFSQLVSQFPLPLHTLFIPILFSRKENRPVHTGVQIDRSSYGVVLYGDGQDIV